MAFEELSCDGAVGGAAGAAGVIFGDRLAEAGRFPDSHAAGDYGFVDGAFEVALDVFDYLTEAATRGEKFDLIVCDPPSFGRGVKLSAGVATMYAGCLIRVG